MSKKARRSRREKFQEGEAHRVAPLRPMTDRQSTLMASIKEHDMTITTGYAGTGKTYIPTVMAIDLWRSGQVEKIILTRPNIASGEKLGFRPGTMYEKMMEWFAEILSIIKDRIGKGALEIAIKNGDIEMVPFETMRGRSFNNAFIILDEAQNTSSHEMKMFTTRIGDGTKTVVNGDVRQSDIQRTSGLQTLVRMVRDRQMSVPIIEFGVSDIVRSGLCRDFILGWMDVETG